MQLFGYWFIVLCIFLIMFYVFCFPCVCVFSTLCSFPPCRSLFIFFWCCVSMVIVFYILFLVCVSLFSFFWFEFILHLSSIYFFIIYSMFCLSMWSFFYCFLLRVRVFPFLSFILFDLCVFNMFLSTWFHHCSLCFNICYVNHIVYRIVRFQFLIQFSFICLFHVLMFCVFSFVSYVLFVYCILFFYYYVVLILFFMFHVFIVLAYLLCVSRSFFCLSILFYFSVFSFFCVFCFPHMFFILCGFSVVHVLLFVFFVRSFVVLYFFAVSDPSTRTQELRAAAPFHIKQSASQHSFCLQAKCASLHSKPVLDSSRGVGS